MTAMDESSIVSFNNENPALQSTIKPDFNNVSVYELALHAMRDRCLLLQRRINSLENENMRLKLESTKSQALTTSYIPLQEDEKFLLNQRIADLTKQKSQLTHHVFMVTCENRNLWNRISGSKRSRNEALNIQKTDGSPPKHARLLRTNTYIHSSPKVMDSGQDKFSETSLEEISLKLINSYIQEKSQLVEQYEQMTELQEGEDTTLNVDYIRFAYLEDPGTDSLKEVQTHTEKLHQLKKTVMQQECEMKAIIEKLEGVVKNGVKCQTCELKATKLTTSEHKEIETSDSLANWATPTDSSTYNDNISEMNSTYKRDGKHDLSDSVFKTDSKSDSVFKAGRNENDSVFKTSGKHELNDSVFKTDGKNDSVFKNDGCTDLNITVIKKDSSPSKARSNFSSDDGERICPMCGYCFDKDFPFNKFQEHVENHFIGEAEPDSMLDNYDLLGHSVGN